MNIVSLSMYSSNKSNYLIKPSLLPYIIQWGLLIFGIIGMWFSGQLTIFHTWLSYHKLTTYDFIKLQREQEALEEARQNDEEQGK